MSLAKRKTQLNLSGSHRSVDADNIWIGTELFVSGASQFTGSAEFQQITGSISGTLGGSPFLVAGSNMGGVNYNAATGQWEITGATGTTVAGANTDLQFNADGVHGASSALTFNTASIGSLAANTLSFPSGAVGVLSGTMPSSSLYYGSPAWQGAGPPFHGSALIVETPLIVSNSFITVDGFVNPSQFGGGQLPSGGIFIQNGGSFSFTSGTLLDSETAAGFGISPMPSGGGYAGWAANPAAALVQGAGVFMFYSGSSSGGGVPGFGIYPGARHAAETYGLARPGETADTVDIVINGFNIRPLWAHATSSHNYPSTSMSQSILVDFLSASSPGSINKVDFSVVAASNETSGGNAGEYGSWLFSATIVKDTSNGIKVIGIDEISAFVTGSGALHGQGSGVLWDVNIGTTGLIEVTGSSYSSDTHVYWYAQTTKQMILGSNGAVLY